ncbi:GNAT family N-acetyltransferase [Acidaminobacter sp. JC074]|uniref:GNAT family N-acetyltransferase n=1 Tax=Acidaminobacter sp. JC074 TaxID=2530199 RepID=UPI001F0EC1E4|nr:GNAT family N-acetyltransferase [Acidaminobacter sp. JC074]MCH4886051.1 GNAT family N-acetyltransferase [Acidaminobacter sp. JC074]
MKINDFRDIKEKLKDFKYTSMTYMDFDEMKAYDIIKNTGEIILAKHGHKYHYACHDLEALMTVIDKKAFIPFVHGSWVERLKACGFEIVAHYQDYFSSLEVDYTPYTLAKLSDAKRLSDITKACYKQSRGFMGEEVAWIENWLQTDHHNIVLTKEDDEIVGLAIVALYGFDKGPTLWLRELAVHPDYQQKGYGRQLMAKAMTYGYDRGARKAFLAADKLNIHAIKLYEDFGFKASGDSQIDMERNK